MSSISMYMWYYVIVQSFSLKCGFDNILDILSYPYFKYLQQKESQE